MYTHGGCEEWMSQRFLNGNAVLWLNDQTLANEILGVLWNSFKNTTLAHIARIENVHYIPEISAHSGDVKLYFPSMMLRSITICLRCQNGGQPTNNVNMITPQAHL